MEDNSPNYIKIGKRQYIKLDNLVEIITNSLTEENINEFIRENDVVLQLKLEDMPSLKSRIYKTIHYFYRMPFFKRVVRRISGKTIPESFHKSLISKLNEANQDYIKRVNEVGENVSLKKILELIYSEDSEEFDIRYLWPLAISNYYKLNELSDTLNNPDIQEICKAYRKKNSIVRKYPETIRQIQSLQKKLEEERKQGSILKDAYDELQVTQITQKREIKELRLKLDQRLNLLMDKEKGINDLSNKLNRLEKGLAEQIRYMHNLETTIEKYEEELSEYHHRENPLYGANIVIIGYHKKDKKELEDYLKKIFGISKIEIFRGIKEELKEFKKLNFDNIDFVFSVGKYAAQDFLKHLDSPNLVKNSIELVNLFYHTNKERISEGISKYLGENYYKQK